MKREHLEHVLRAVSQIVHDYHDRGTAILAKRGDRDQRRMGEAAGATVWTTADIAVARSLCLLNRF